MTGTSWEDSGKTAGCDWATGGDGGDGGDGGAESKLTITARDIDDATEKESCDELGEKMENDSVRLFICAGGNSVCSDSDKAIFDMLAAKAEDSEWVCW